MNRLNPVFCLLLFLSLAACSGDQTDSPESAVSAAATDDYPEGPNGGRLLEADDFAIELSIYEAGVPPEYRAWAYADDTLLAPSAVDLNVVLTRLGDVRDHINFNPEGDYLRGDTVIYEPHSFIVTVTANYQGQQHSWEFDSLEGRTTISPAMAEAMGLETEVAGPATLLQTLDVIGKTVETPESTRRISARFEGAIRDVYVSVGQQVEPGQRLLTIESNSSLQPYTMSAPIAGTVVRRMANPGEQTNGRVLLEILDTQTVWAELAIHPSRRQEVSVGMPVTVTSPISGMTARGQIDSFDLAVRPNQAITARVQIANEDNVFAPGTFVNASIETGQFEVTLAVKRVGLQPFRDFTVVYTKIGNTYEVRMLDLGRQDAEWVEVLGGLEPGSTYVTTNSYVLKADVEKDGASHDH
jgi:cobalt-zinc-cadmium efflux system membrane fusion protein